MWSKDKKISAYTLQELLIVLVIIGILILLALPSLMPLVSRAKSLEAQMQLKHVASLQRSHFMLKSEYSSDLEEIGFEHEKTIQEGGNANYLVELIEADHTGFIARATAISDFDGDGQLNIWEVDESSIIKEIQRD